MKTPALISEYDVRRGIERWENEGGRIYSAGEKGIPKRQLIDHDDHNGLETQHREFTGSNQNAGDILEHLVLRHYRVHS